MKCLLHSRMSPTVKSRKFKCQFAIFKPLSYCFKETIEFKNRPPLRGLQFRLMPNQVIQQKKFNKMLFNSTGTLVDGKLQTGVELLISVLKEIQVYFLCSP